SLAPSISSTSKTILNFIDERHITSFLKSKSKSCPGPDGISTADLVPFTKEVQLLINWCLWRRSIPDAWRTSKTSLIPKKQSGRPEDYRPITVSSLLYRCLTAALAKQLRRVAPLSQHQKGFVEQDGICEAITTMRYVVKNHARARIAALDVSKAFDSL